MSSPQETTSDGTRKNFEQITFRFCSECSNMLYPKEDPDSHKLQFTCRTCQYTEEATSTCVFRNIMNNAVGETAGVTQDVGSDPTVSSSSPASSSPDISMSGTPAPHDSPTAGLRSGEYAGEYPIVDELPDTQGSPDSLPTATEDVNIDDHDNSWFNLGTLPYYHHADRDFHGAIRGVIATSIYNCLDPIHQASIDRDMVESLTQDLPINPLTASLPAYFGESYAQDEDADPPEALGEEPFDMGLGDEF
ncbi:hypothetical protein TruAng_000066 [Truncatella angustata]|nr:hypothetical protein TruAng_000066 [Truncatella angustata]